MAVSMNDVRRVLDAEEPNYDAAAKLGPDALPHLQALVAGPDPMLASKAAYAASLLEGALGESVVHAAAQSHNPVVRVAAAAAARNLPPSRHVPCSSGSRPTTTRGSARWLEHPRRRTGSRSQPPAFVRGRPIVEPPGRQAEPILFHKSADILRTSHEISSGS